LTHEQLVHLLRDPAWVRDEPFSVLKGISREIGRAPEAPRSRELVLRALEHRSHLGPLTSVLDALVREIGLFPYLKPERFGVRDLIAYEFHRSAELPKDIVFHCEQAEIYR